MLSEKMENALNEQINAELWSGYLYLSMSLCAARNGHPGLSHWMYVQSQEEQDHARRLQCYMLSQDAAVELRAIASVPTDWDNAREMLRETLMHEREVTSMIEALVTLAHTENDYATLSRLQWFIDEQVEEEENVRNILSALDMVDDDTCGSYLVDQHLLHREFPSKL